MAPDPPVDTATWLRELGFASEDAAQTARATLEAAGLTRPGKTGMATSKLLRAKRAIADALARYCGDAECMALLPAGGRRPVVVPAQSCQVCGGSNNRRAIGEMASACQEFGITRLLVVGGTPRTEEALRRDLAPHPIELRVASGTDNEPSLRDALDHCRWADLVAVWAPTPLPHKVSTLYTGPQCNARRVLVHSRGLEAFAHAVTDHLRAAPGARVIRR
jgi:hypothetical protein